MLWCGPLLEILALGVALVIADTALAVPEPATLSLNVNGDRRPGVVLVVLDSGRTYLGREVLATP